jgi:hypothetical protein
MAGRRNHPSKLFSYRESWLAGTPDDVDIYHDCLLLTDIKDPVNCIHSHQADKCRKGVVLCTISDDGKWLRGYDDHNNLVLHVISPLPL